MCDEDVEHLLKDGDLKDGDLKDGATMNRVVAESQGGFQVTPCLRIRNS